MHRVWRRFCSVEFRGEHCSLCKCKGCEFCGCTSGHADDGALEACDDWCSVEFHADHCSWCSCKGCDFCRTGPPCDSFLPDDTLYETCDTFCDPAFALQHCEHCKCKGCEWCATDALALLAPPEQQQQQQVARPEEERCDSGVVGDTDHRACEHFCNRMGGAAHCRMCKCQVRPHSHRVTESQSPMGDHL